MSLTYVCSILNPIKTVTFESFKIQPCESVVLVLMATTEEIPRYVFRAGPLANGEFIYEDSSNFQLEDDIINLFLVRPLFAFRCICDNKNIRVLRIFAFDSAFPSHLNPTVNRINEKTQLTQTLFDNEQYLFNLFAKSIVVCEPLQNFDRNEHGIVQSPNPRKTNSASVSFRRSLSNEQNLSAQHLLEILNAKKNISYNVNLTSNLCKNLCVDFQNALFSTSPVKKLTWEPTGSLLTFTRGCGRRRILSTVAHQITESKESHQDICLDKFYAPLCFVIICKEYDFIKWQKEFKFTNTRVCEIREADDFEQLTFQDVTQGVVLLVSPNSLHSTNSKSIQNFVNALLITDSHARPTSRRQFDLLRGQRLFIKSFTQRFPRARLPCGLLRAKAILVDDFPLNDSTRKLFQDIDQVFEADWKFVTLGYDGEPPRFLHPNVLDTIDTFFNIPMEARTVHDTLVPDIWRLFSEYNTNLVTYMQTPRCLLRKVSLVAIECGPTEQENQFFANMLNIKQSQTALPVKLCDQDITNSLVGAELCGIAGCTLKILLPRLETISFENAMKNCEDHFEKENGTIAQRISKSHGNSFDLATGDFVKKTLKDIMQTTCQICLSDPSTVLTMCGHVFCKDCYDHVNISSIVNCPACRSLLCEYDWIKIGSYSNLIMPSKMQNLLNTLDQVFSKRRSKRRSGLSAWIIAPQTSIEELKKLLQENRDFLINTSSDTISNQHKVFLTCFEDFTLKLNDDPHMFSDDNIEALVMVCPSSNEMYHKLVRSSRNRHNSLQFHLLYANGLENIDDAKRLFLL